MTLVDSEVGRETGRGPVSGDDQWVSADDFRAAMASVPTPVSVVTVMADGRPHGTTVSAFSSLSATPAMVTIALDGGSVLLTMLEVGSQIGVNVLTRDQADIAMRFASKAGDRFGASSWSLDGGVPRLAGSGGWLRCEVTDLIGGGDHTIVLAAVVDAVPASDPPLTYHGRRFGTHLPL